MSLPTRELQADRRQSIITQGILCLETSKFSSTKEVQDFALAGWLYNAAGQMLLQKLILN